jgi:hypothetical protein
VVDLRVLECDCIFSNYQNFQGDYVLSFAMQRKDDVSASSRSVRVARWPYWSFDVQKRKEMEMVAIFSSILVY